MPHAILRALRHRSTPTLLPSTSTSASTTELPQSHLNSIPSIFVTVPDEEGSHHWCVLAGTAAPLYQRPGHQAFDAPLPDFAALEETISQLKRAGETPTFKRPGQKDDVVLPKKKHGHGKGAAAHHHHQHQHEHHHQHHQPQHPQHGHHAAGKRPRPKRPQTSPITITRRERFQVEDDDISNNQDYFGASPSDVQMIVDTPESPPASGRFTPTKVLRSLSKSKRTRPPPVFTSVSYESVVAQPMSAPASTSSFDPTGKGFEQTPKRKRSSLGWLFQKRAATVPAALPQEEVVLVERLFVVPEIEITPPYEEEDELEEPPSPVGTHESDLDKPLPPIPAELANSSSEDVMASETMSPSTSSEASAAEMQINDSIQVQVGIPFSYEAQAGSIDFPTSTSSDLSSQAAPGQMDGGKKIKRKFSLKRLRERFLSSPTPVEEVPPVPPVPVLPSTMHTFLASGPIDPPFTPPSMEDATFPASTVPMPSKRVTSMDESVAEASPARVTLDEDSNVSTSSEDSSGISSSVSSTPDNSPPETPGADSVGPVFELLQGSKITKTIETDVAIVEPHATGITRSTGMRQLDSLRFEEMTF